MVTPIAAIQAGVCGSVLVGAAVSTDKATADGAVVGSGALVGVWLGVEMCRGGRGR